MLLALGIWESVKKAIAFLEQWALGMGGFGLLLLAMGDSSVLSIPEGNDLLIAVKSMHASWTLMSYYVAMTVLGSSIGCTLLYAMGRRGSSWFVRRFDPKRIEDIGRLYSRRGIWTLFVPTILPPPMPFKVVVLSAGIFRVPYKRFILTILAGRTVRYGTWGVLAVLYGAAVRTFIIDNAKIVGSVLSLLLLAALAVALLVAWRRRRRRAAALPAVNTKAAMLLVCLSALMGVRCNVKTTRDVPIPPSYLNAKTAALPDLIQLVNDDYARVENLTSGSLEVEVTGEAARGSVIQEDKYRRAKGVLIAARPDGVYLNIKNPLTGGSVATMASHAGAFQIWVPRENKFFVGRTDVELENDDPILSIRPNHLLEALLIERIPRDDPDLLVTLREEQDDAYKYYVVSVIRSRPGSSLAELEREVWFERSQMRLARQKYYRSGAILSSIRYNRPVEVSGRHAQAEIEVQRPREQYTLKLELNPDSIRIDRNLKEGTFEVVQPPAAELVVVDQRHEVPPRF